MTSVFCSFSWKFDKLMKGKLWSLKFLWVWTALLLLLLFVFFFFFSIKSGMSEKVLGCFGASSCIKMWSTDSSLSLSQISVSNIEDVLVVGAGKKTTTPFSSTAELPVFILDDIYIIFWEENVLLDVLRFAPDRWFSGTFSCELDTVRRWWDNSKPAAECVCVQPSHCRRPQTSTSRSVAATRLLLSYFLFLNFVTLWGKRIDQPDMKIQSFNMNKHYLQTFLVARLWSQAGSRSGQLSVKGDALIGWLQTALFFCSVWSKSAGETQKGLDGSHWVHSWILDSWISPRRLWSYRFFTSDVHLSCVQSFTADLKHIELM